MKRPKVKVVTIRHRIVALSDARMAVRTLYGEYLRAKRDVQRLTDELIAASNANHMPNSDEK
jgi:hypothetical protein